MPQLSPCTLEPVGHYKGNPHATTGREAREPQLEPSAAKYIYIYKINLLKIELLDKSKKIQNESPLFIIVDIN